MTRLTLALLGCSLVFGCSTGQGSPLRSPALDYQPPPPESDADNQPVGADRVAPSDKLQQGVSSSSLAPGWNADKSGPAYDPKKRIGGSVDPAQASPSQK